MLALTLAAALAVAQYPSPQAPYGAPAPPPAQYGAPPAMTYTIPVTYSAPQVAVLGAGQVIPPGPFGMLMGHLARKLEKHAWPRVQPIQMAAQPAAPLMQTVYLQVAAPAPQVYQAAYAAPQQVYAAPPSYGSKSPPTPYGSPQGPQSPYGSPQAPAGGGANPYGAARPGEGAPPVPNR